MSKQLKETPKCFKSDLDFQLWTEKNTDANGCPIVPNYCWDCTRSYQKVAIKAGTCKYPDTFFIDVENMYGEMEEIGVRWVDQPK